MTCAKRFLSFGVGELVSPPGEIYKTRKCEL